MKNFILLVALFLVAPFAQGSFPQHLLVGGSGWNKIAIINKDTKEIVWEYPLEKGWECNSVAATKAGEILFSYSKGAKMITRDGRELWNIAAPAGCEMQTARILPDGNALVAWCGHPSTILEVNMKGEVLSKTEFETGIERPHAQFRQINKNKKGNYLVPLFATSEVREIAPNGGLYICNWQGHDREAGKGKHPQLVEIDSEGKVVWQLNDKVKFGMISTICPIRE